MSTQHPSHLRVRPTFIVVWAALLAVAVYAISQREPHRDAGSGIRESAVIGAPTRARPVTRPVRPANPTAIPAVVPKPTPKPRTVATTTSNVPTTTSTVAPRPAPVPAAPAPAVTAPPPPPPPDQYQLCAAAVWSVTFPPGWHVVCLSSRSGLLGLTNASFGTEMFTRYGLPQSEYFVIALHEAGNAWDLARLDGAKRATWCAARGCDAARFFQGGASGPGWVEAGGAEDWAEVWRDCHGGGYGRSYIGLGPPGGELCSLQRALVGGG